MKISFSNKVVLYLAVTLCCVLVPTSVLSQSDKDTKRYDELEQDVRKDLDKQIAKFKPLTKPSQATPSQNKVTTLDSESSYDKFKDVTTVSIVTPIQDLKEIVNVRLKGYIAIVDVYATYSYAGLNSVKPTAINLIFKTFADSPLFGFNPSLIVIADNRRFRLGNMSQTVQRVATRSVNEFLSIPVAYEVFAEIANADLVEVQIENIDFPLSDLNLMGFRKIAGLPERPKRPVLQTLGTAVSDSTTLSPTLKEDKNIENTIWQSEPYSAKFSSGGVFLLNFNGSPYREGTWKQNGDRIEVELPQVSLMTNGLRGLSVGIVKGNKIVMKTKLFGLLGSPSFFAVMERTP